MIRYFAYGSNLMVDRMRERGAAFSEARPAVLRDHCLVFDKRSADGSARANVERSPGDCVHGVIYRMALDGLEALRQFESGYDLVDRQVEAARPQGGVEALAVKVFVARSDRRTSAPPQRRYVALILQGLAEHGLPEEARHEVERALARKVPGGGAGPALT
ncbi:MAG: gamma-glutamylcyclotransferase [Anaeromyxobacter sp.]|nr:gamma-glutamylcyclotransferase [Anaeromyxobacter sp.]MBL0275255.1 gamma-glutamylcyclotransferase [Anaeromyxobacter sp.]